MDNDFYYITYFLLTYINYYILQVTLMLKPELLYSVNVMYNVIKHSVHTSI